MTHYIISVGFILAQMKKVFIFLFILILFSIPKSSYASTIFEDNFNQYSDGVFPTKWRLFHPSFEAPQCVNASAKVENGVLKLKVNQSGCTYNLIPTTVEWPLMKDSYIFESDITLVSGTDRHFSYRFSPIAPELIRTIHFFSSGDFSVETDNPYYNTYVQKILLFNHTYHFKMEVKNDGIKVFVGEPGDEPQLVRDTQFITPIWAGTIGLGESPGSGNNTETWFDNVKVTTLDDQSSNDLAVPLLKQTDPLWANDIYDSAPSWQSPGGGITIGRIGCALTSAAMVMQYYGLSKMPDGVTNLNPQSLNNWMNSLNDSNFRNGSTNWAALAGHLTPLLASINNTNFDRFEVKMENFDTQKLNDYLNNKNPVILNVPGHFVVAKGIDTINNSYSINDPYYDRSSLNNYGDTYSRSITFVPAHSDSSYLVFIVDPNVQIKLKDVQGNIVGETFIEDSVQDELQVSTNLVGPLKALYFAKPPTANYIVEVTSSNATSYFLQGYLYDVNGNVKMFERKDVLAQNNTDTYQINFNKNNSTNINIGQNVTLATLKNDVVALYSLGHIKKEFYKELLEKIKEVEKNQNKKGNEMYHKLKELNKEIGKKKGIDAYATDILSHDIQVLISSVPPSSHDED